MPLDQLDDHLRSDAPNWVHLDRLHSRTRPWLDSTISFLDPVVIDAMLEQETRPRMVQVGDGAMIVLRAVNHNPGAEPEDMVSLRLWIDAKRIISLQGRAIRALDEMVRVMQGKNCPRNSGEFLTLLAELLIDPMQPVLDEIEDEIDSAEEKMTKRPNQAVGNELSDIRRTANALRRYIAPQREVFGQLINSGMSWLSKTDRRHLQESQHNTIRYVDDLDQIRERAQLAKDELQNVFTAKLSRNSFLFTVLAAIFMPLSFVTGLFGINVGGIPGAAGDNAFWIFAGILAVILIAEIAIFRWLKWF